MARDSVSAMIGSSPGCAADNLHPEELAKFKLSSNQAETVMREVLAPKLKGFEVIALSGQPLQQGVSISYQFRCKNSTSEVLLPIVIVETPNGPKTFLSQIAMGCLRTIEAQGIAKKDERWRRDWNELTTQLSKSGLTGYYDLSTGRVFDWPQM
ncbi:MAG: hypothetical protein CBB60_005700 [Armatimonadetes bacterium Cent15-Ar3]|nr:MAG: hypothetical protein CBB60_005700 [Armatimonadetes bacterium Cent15-Ar3]